MDIEQERIPAGNRLVIINRQNDHVWANLWVNANRGLAHADITHVRWKGKTMSTARSWARKQLHGTEDWHWRSMVFQWPFRFSYTLKSTACNSERYGPCELCKGHAAEVYIQTCMELHMSFPWDGNCEGPPSPFYAHRGSSFGHKACLLKAQCHDLITTFVSP